MNGIREEVLTHSRGLHIHLTKSKIPRSTEYFKRMSHNIKTTEVSNIVNVVQYSAGKTMSHGIHVDVSLICTTHFNTGKDWHTDKLH